MNVASETSTSRDLVRTLAAHDGPVKALAVAPSGRFLATGGMDGMVRIWRERDGGLVASVKGHQSEVAGLAWLPGDAEETRLASAEANGAIKIWDWRSESESASFESGHRVRALAVEDRTRWLVTAGDDRTLRLFDSTDGTSKGVLHGHQDRVLCLATIPGRDEVLSGSEDRTLRGWSLNPLSARWTLRGAEDSIRAVAVASSAAWAVSGGDDCVPRLWRLEPGKERSDRPVGTKHRGSVRCVGVLEEGLTEPLVAAGGAGEGVQLWEAHSGSERALLHGHAGAVEVVRSNARTDWFASGGEDGTVRVWKTAHSASRKRPALEHRARINALTSTTDGTVVTASDDHTLKTWSADDGRLLGTLRGHLDAVTALVELPDRRIASASADRTVRVWDLNRCELLTMYGSPVDVSGVPETVVPQSLSQKPGHLQAVTCLATVGDQRIASGSRDGTVQLWNLSTGRAERQLRARGVIDHLLWSPARQALIAAGTARELSLWDLKTAEWPRVLTGHSGRVGAAALADEAGVLVSGGYDGEVRLWNLGSGLCDRTARPHDGWVLCVDSDPTARVFASGGKDGAIWLWNRTNGETPQRLNGHSGAVRGLRLAPEPTRLASFGEDGWLRVWDVAGGREVAAAHFDSPITCIRWAHPGCIVFGTRWGGLGILRIEKDF